MNLTRPSEVKSLLDLLGHQPNKTMGQNFLIDANILRILLRAADLHPHDTVLEVGPGLGVLTEGLLLEAGHVVAVEKDPRLCEHLRAHFRNAGNLTLVEGDILRTDIGEIFARGANKVIANLPYAVGSRFLYDAINAASPPERIVVTVQKEVGDRLASRPDRKEYGLLGVVAQLRYSVDSVKEIKRTCFLPPPDITSAIVSLARRTDAPEPLDRAHLLRLLKTAFAHRRKQLAGILAKAPDLNPAGRDVAAILADLKVEPRARPENLPPDAWRALSDALRGA